MSIVCAFALTSTAIASPLPKSSVQTVSIAKFTNEFAKFNAHRQQRGVELTWIFTDPGNVVSFVVQRSYDGEFYENVTEIPASGKNQYKDDAVFPGYLYYRIGALMYDGSVIYSNVEVVRIVRNG